MRVLYVLAHFPQNSESYVEAEMTYVASLGIQIEVWSPLAGYGDAPKFPVRRTSLKDALDGFRPDVIHIHHMTTASYYIDQLPKGLVTVRAHSFDWDETLVRKLVYSPAVRRLFAFPQFARRLNNVVPLPVAYDSILYRRCDDKNRRKVVRLAAGLPTKNLGDFLKIGNKLGDEADFTLAINLVRGKESLFDDLQKENRSLGGHVEILANLSRAQTAELVSSAGIYLSTHDASAHPFGMPISIAEAMATGAFVVARSAPGIDGYLGNRISYDSVAAAEELVRFGLNLKDEERAIVADESCRNAERFRSDVVLPRLVEEWNRICLDNF